MVASGRPLIRPEDCGDLSATLTIVERLAGDVPDPELVVVTVGDLGILRAVRAEDGQFVLDVTPTYSACPATLAIEIGIETAVRDAGYDARTNRVLAPAWTTEWISNEGRSKLKASGIAPPERANHDSKNGFADAGGTVDDGIAYFAVQSVTCPRCDSRNTRRLAAFGSTACKAQYQCNSCAEPFDYFKCL